MAGHITVSADMAGIDTDPEVNDMEWLEMFLPILGGLVGGCLGLVMAMAIYDIMLRQEAGKRASERGE